MKRLLKYSLLTVSITAILVTGLIVFLIFFLDLNSYKPLISQIVKEKMQRELEFDGDISFAVFPKLGISLKQVSLSEHKTSKKFITADYIHLTLPLKQSLKNKLVIDEIIIKGLKASLIRFPDGRTNIDNLLTTNKKKMEFELERARIENTMLVFHDVMNKKQYALSDLNLTAGKITSDQLNNLKLETIGSMTNLSNHANYDFAIKLDIPDIQFGHGHIASNNIRLVTKGPHPQSKIFGEFSLSNLIMSTHYFSSDDMVIKILAKKETQIIKAHLSSPLNGNLDSQKLHLPDLKSKFAISTNDLSSQSICGYLLGNISLAGIPEHIDADFTGNIEDSHIQASFNITGFDNPAINFDVTVDQLNSDRLLLKSSESDTKAKKNIKTQPLDEIIDFSLLTDINANGSIHVGKLQFADISLSNIEFKIQSGNNNLNPASTPVDNSIEE